MLSGIMAALGHRTKRETARVGITVVESLEDPPNDLDWGNTLDGAHLAFSFDHYSGGG
jgi:hypothetical protein